jgi:hypothetical protein
MKQQKFDSLPDAVFPVADLKKLMSDVLRSESRWLKLNLSRGSIAQRTKNPAVRKRAAR